MTIRHHNGGPWGHTIRSHLSIKSVSDFTWGNLYVKSPTLRLSWNSSRWRGKFCTSERDVFFFGFLEKGWHMWSLFAATGWYAWSMLHGKHTNAWHPGWRFRTSKLESGRIFRIHLIHDQPTSQKWIMPLYLAVISQGRYLRGLVDWRIHPPHAPCKSPDVK